MKDGLSAKAWNAKSDPKNRPKKVVKIHIGQYHTSKLPRVIHTIVGSCVAVCLFDPKTRIGGMNHILVPGKADLSSINPSSCYAVNSMELLINSLIRKGVKKVNLAAKIFGGAKVLSLNGDSGNLGTRNSRFVLEFLKNESIPVKARDLGGQQARMIHFHSDTGDVLVKKIQPQKLQEVLEGQKKICKRIRKSLESQMDVTLFERGPVDKG